MTNSTFLYYRSGIDRKPNAKEAAPVAYAFDDLNGSIGHRPCTKGPNGAGAGTVFWRSSGTPELLGMYPESQEWRSVPGSDLMVGHYTDRALPGPDDLAARRQLPGHLVELGDGRRWLVPIARRWVEVEGAPVFVPALPTEPELDDDGEWQPGEVDRAYRTFWETSCRWWDAKVGGLQQGEGEEITLGDGLDMTLEVLQVNYRIGRVEAATLGLFRDNRGVDVLDAAIDWQGLGELSDALEKKRGAEQSEPAT